MDCNEIGCPDDKHEVRRKVLKNVVDGLKICQILFSEIFPLLSSHRITNFLFAIDCPEQENYR